MLVESIKIKAILLGFLAYLLIPVLAGIFAGLSPFDLSGYSYASLGFDAFAWGIVSVATIALGYVTAHFSKERPFLNAFLGGALVVAVNVAYTVSLEVFPTLRKLDEALSSYSGRDPIWVELLSFVLTVPLALLGAYISVRRKDISTNKN